MSIIFRTTARCIVIILYIISLYFFLRGHNNPGGGFIAGLLATMASLLLIFSNLFNLVIKPAIIWIVVGLLALLVSLALPLVFEQAPLTAGWWRFGDLFLGTPILFDFGILSVTIGSGLLLMKTILQDEK